MDKEAIKKIIETRHEGWQVQNIGNDHYNGYIPIMMKRIDNPDVIMTGNFSIDRMEWVY